MRQPPRLAILRYGIRVTSPAALTTHPVPIRTDADGVSRVGASRVTLDTLIGAFLDGCTPEEIAVKYPSLDLADVYAVIAHYLSHQIEIDAYLAERQADAATVRQTIHQSQGTAGVRERLLARRRVAS